MADSEPYEWGDLSFGAFDADQLLIELLAQMALPATPLLPSIVDQFVCRTPGVPCPACNGEGYVCEDHPDHPWLDGDCCGAAGMPCAAAPSPQR